MLLFMRCTPQQLEQKMENSRIERAAVAAVQAPTVPLAVLVEALAALKVAMNQPTHQTTPFETYQLLARSVGKLGYSVDKMLAAQAVGVTA